MSFLPVAIFAYFLNACAVTADKFLLKKFIPDPVVYIFYFSLFSTAALILIPFTGLPEPDILFLTSLSTLLWTFGAYFMFKALKTGQVSRVIPVISTLTPVVLLIHAFIFSTISINQTWAAGFLISGLFLITFVNWKGNLVKQELVYEFLASMLFAVSYLILREAYLKEDFLTVLVWSRFILLPVGIFIMLIPLFRRKIFSSNRPKVNFTSPLGLTFIGGQLAGGTSQMLLIFSISLATPALINSLQGIQYIFLFLFAILLSKKFPGVFTEKLSRAGFISKTAGIIVIAFGLYILSFSPRESYFKPGVTYSPLHAANLGLNPHLTFYKLLEDLKVKIIRLPVYWTEIETFPKKINFSQIDFYLNEADKRGVKVILVLGYKQPRWPECFAPEWVKKTTRQQRHEEILALVEKEISYFKKFKNIYAWQVENEPLFYFGDCDKITADTGQLLKKEVEIIKRQDNRPILITDSGELSSWIDTIKIGDLLGHSLYREVHSPYFGYTQYPLPPAFYHLKGLIAKFLTNSGDKKIIISELQAEPWISRGDSKPNPWEEAKLFPVSKLDSNIEYARQTGAQEIILWGVEWWYYMEQNGYPEYLNYAKNLFK